jgi:LysM repeat protein
MQAIPGRTSRFSRSRQAAQIPRLAVPICVLLLLFAIRASSNQSAPTGDEWTLTAEDRGSEPQTWSPPTSREFLAGRSPEGLSLHVQRYVPMITNIADDVGVDPAVLAALMEVESSGTDAVSVAGAMGLMQLMPDKLSPGDDPFEPATNIRRAAELVQRLSRSWRGDLAAVAGSYFGAVDNQGNVTEASDGIVTGGEYVRRFSAAYERWSTALGQPPRPVVIRAHPTGPIARYTVQPGDSVRELAKLYGISIATLAAANQIANPDLLVVGQELRIPRVDGVVHTVQSGETASMLAQRYGVTTRSVLEANHLDNELREGALLLVPGAELPSPTVNIESEPATAT